MAEEKNEQCLLGDPESALRNEFLEAASEGKLHKVLPFKGKINLPTREQVIKLYLYLRKLPGHYNMSKENLAQIVTEHICVYWEMANFSTIQEKHIKKKVLKELVMWKTLHKNKRNTEIEQTKKTKYLQDVKLIFDVASKDLEDKLNKDRLLLDKTKPTEKQKERLVEDLAFLKDQYGPRLSSMGPIDSKYKAKTDNRVERMQKVSSREKKYLVKTQEEEKILQDLKLKHKIWSQDVEDSMSDKDYKVNNAKRSKMVTLELPRNPWNSPEVTSMLDRTKVTSRQAVGVFSALVKTGTVEGKEVDLNDFTLSQSSVHRSRDKNRIILLQKAKEEFQKNKPKHITLHWDGKMMKTVLGEEVEWQSILVSGSPHYQEGKLLTVTRLTNEEGKPTSTGLAQSVAATEQMDEWKIREWVRKFVFDTTASNSGVHKGCCVRVMKNLGKVVFLCGCRHHICELVAKSCWYSMFQLDLSPECKFFNDVKAALANIDTSNEASITELPQNLFNKKEAVDFYMWLLAKKNRENENLVRDDYRELAIGSLRLLGVKLNNDEMIWKKCGATHKARFAAFGIYSNKALAFSEQLDLDPDMVSDLKRFCSFFVTLYIPHFLSSSIGADAAINDLTFYKQLFDYRTVDPGLAEAALSVMARHGWYLVPQMVPFSLFSSKMDDDSKSALATKILSFEDTKPSSYPLIKPVFPAITSTTQLTDLVGPDSYMFFHILGISYEWIKVSPSHWEEYDSYKEAREFVRTTKVVNDLAERGIKMISDYAMILTNDEEMRVQLLQGVELNRRKYPDFKKKTLNSLM